MNRVHFKSEKQNWKTPKAFYQALDSEFKFDFVNPPYNELPRATSPGSAEGGSKKYPCPFCKPMTQEDEVKV